MSRRVSKGSNKSALIIISLLVIALFAIGEFLNPVAMLDRDTKRKLQIYTRELSFLVDAIQARDYGRARELEKLATKVADFTKALDATINT